MYAVEMAWYYLVMEEISKNPTTETTTGMRPQVVMRTNKRKWEVH